MAQYIINTDYDPKPIPARVFDWSAWLGDMDLGVIIGAGATEREAIESLLGMIAVEDEMKEEAA